MFSFENETIHITNLRVDCVLGVTADERAAPQPVLISASFPSDFAPAAAQDTLAEVTNYSEVARVIRQFVRESRFHLMETLARRLAMHLSERFGLRRVDLSVRKPASISGSDGPAVSLTLHRNGGAGP